MGDGHMSFMGAERIIAIALLDTDHFPSYRGTEYPEYESCFLESYTLCAKQSIANLKLSW